MKQCLLSNMKQVRPAAWKTICYPQMSKHTHTKTWHTHHKVYHSIRVLHWIQKVVNGGRYQIKRVIRPTPRVQSAIGSSPDPGWWRGTCVHTRESGHFTVLIRTVGKLLRTSQIFDLTWWFIRQTPKVSLALIVTELFLKKDTCTSTWQRYARFLVQLRLEKKYVSMVHGNALGMIFRLYSLSLFC